MRVEIDEDYTIRLKEVFNSVVFETAEGNELVVCMRDGGFEIAVRGFKEKVPHCEPIRPLHWYCADELGIRPLAFNAIRGQEKSEQGKTYGGPYEYKDADPVGTNSEAEDSWNTAIERLRNNGNVGLGPAACGSPGEAKAGGANENNDR